MHPASLLAGGWDHLLQRGPKPHGSVTGDQFWSLEAEKHFSPALCAFPNAVLNGKKVLLTKGVDVDYNEYAEPVIGSAQSAVDAVCPDVDPFIAAQISFPPVVVLRCPLALQAGDRFRGKTGGLRAEQHFESRAHFACGEPLQI